MSERNYKPGKTQRRGPATQQQRIQEEFFRMVHSGEIMTLDLGAWAEERQINLKTAQHYFRNLFGMSLENYKARKRREEAQIQDLPPEIIGQIVNLALRWCQSYEYRYLELLDKFYDEKCAGLLNR